MKEHGILFKGEMIRAYMAGQKTQTRRVVKPQPDEEGLAFNLLVKEWHDTSGRVYKCPYGQVGDVLWFREEWNTQVGPMGESRIIVYRATDPYEAGSWKRSLFMPRWACRHTAKIVSIKAERLQDINRMDAMEEGIGHMHGYDGLWPAVDAVRRFRELWHDINGKKPGKSWSDNPLVWRIEFERYKSCGDQ